MILIVKVPPLSSVQALNTHFNKVNIVENKKEILLNLKIQQASICIVNEGTHEDLIKCVQEVVNAYESISHSSTCHNRRNSKPQEKVNV